MLTMQVAGTPLMELMAALEEEMQGDGGVVASSDPVGTPPRQIHPVDPLLAESRPSTAQSGDPGHPKLKNN